MLVFAATALAFWWHFERRMAALQPAPMASPFLVDQHKLLGAEEARSLHRWRTAFKEGLGMDVLVLVSPGNVDVPPFAPGTLFVGAGGSSAVIVLPPLARKALGEGPRLETEEALAACLRHERPAPCLEKTLSTLWRHLGGQ